MYATCRVTSRKGKMPVVFIISFYDYICPPNTKTDIDWNRLLLFYLSLDVYVTITFLKYTYARVVCAEYTCYGHWKNEATGVSYVIATPQGRSTTNSRRYCFIMSQVNGMVQQTLNIASVMESCHPHPLGRLHWAFNITHQGRYNVRFSREAGVRERVNFLGLAIKS